MGTDTRVDAILTEESISTLRQLARKHRATTDSKSRPPFNPNPFVWTRMKGDSGKDTTVNGNADVNGTVSVEGEGRGPGTTSGVPTDVGNSTVHPESTDEVPELSRREVHRAGDIGEHEGSVR